MERIANKFNENGVQRVLDLGCGTGRHLLFLLKRGLEIAKTWLAEENLSSELVCQKIEDTLPYGDGFFDAVISITILGQKIEM